MGEGPDARYAAILGDRLSLRLRGLWSNGQLELSRAEVRSPGFTSNVVGTLGLAGPLTPRLRYVADIPELRSLAQLVGLRAAGRVRAQGTIAGRVGATEGQRAGTLEILGQLEVTRAQVNDESIGTVRIRHDAVLGDTVRAGFDLRMDSPSFGAGKASGRFEQGPQKWRVDHLDVDLLGVRASGTARGAYVNQQVVGVQGEFLLDIASLADIGRVAGLALAGNGGGKIRVSAEREGTAVIDMALQNLEVEGLALSSASIHGSVAGLTAKLEPRLTLQAHGGTGPNGKLRALSVVLNGPLDALALKAEVSAEFESQPVTLSALAKADLDGPSKMFRFDALRATLAADTVSLGTPLTVLVDGTEVTMDGLDLLLPDGGRLAGTAQWSSEALRGSMVLNGAPLRFITALLDVPVAQGTLDAKVEVNTGAEAPVLDAGVHIDDVRMEGVDPGAVARGVPPVSVDATASWDGESLAVRSELIGEFGPPVTVQAKIAMHATDTWLPEVGLHEPLEAVIGWRGKLARLFALFPLPDRLLAGDTVLNIRVGGSAHDPAVSGALEISRGRYENLLLGTIIDDFSLTTKFTEQGALALALDGTDGARGTLSLRGDVTAVRSDAPGLNVQARLHDFLLVRIDTATAEVAGDLNVTGLTNDLDVQGSVQVQRAEIRLLNTLPTSVVDLGEVRLRGVPRREASPAPVGGGKVALDINVDFPSQVFVRGRGLDSEWGGELRVQGTAALPGVTGRISARSGQLDLIGRIFKLVRGEIAFSGGQPIDPSVSITLAREANGITGQIKVEGPASSPELTFSAVPPAPEDEVLARVLFGRSTSNLSTTEALELAAGVAALTSGGVGVVDQLRNALGVDVLRLESAEGEEGSTTAAVGRYLREGVYVGAKQSLDGKRSSVVLEIELLDEVIFDLDLGYTARSSAGVTWRRDF